MLSIKIPLKGINDVKKILIEENLMDKSYKIKTDKYNGFIPIKSQINIEELKIKLNEVGHDDLYRIAIEDVDLESFKKKPISMREQLKGNLTDKEIKDMKTSFDVIGDLVLLEIPENLEKHKKIIGKEVLKFTKTRSVFMKKSGIKGTIRTREIELIGGEDSSRTIHKEHGIKLALDLRRVYFSPRLATERKKVEKQASEDELILDMFTGVGPFPILMAKNKNIEVYGVDINEVAIDYLKENIKINKLNGVVHPIHGDINDVAVEFNEKNLRFDRIIMNLPETAYKFLDLAISLIKNDGTIHYYEFGDDYDSIVNRVENMAIKHDKNIEILDKRKVKSTGPRTWHIGVDVKIVGS
ncbi:MAG: class I SAM-dependent methyltransferase family protein [Methanobrevibacter sp.]|jgi:tRNA (guanine37-N1)-methyltransferase|nr:class I SAM-dependent methyltransferase family protein [Candidatus Methanovirga aequatorialis]